MLTAIGGVQLLLYGRSDADTAGFKRARVAGLPPTDGLPLVANDRCLRDYDLVVAHC